MAELGLVREAFRGMTEGGASKAQIKTALWTLARGPQPPTVAEGTRTSSLETQIVSLEHSLASAADADDLRELGIEVAALRIIVEDLRAFMSSNVPAAVADEFPRTIEQLLLKYVNMLMPDDTQEVRVAAAALTTPAVSSLPSPASHPHPPLLLILWPSYGSPLVPCAGVGGAR